MAFVSNAYSYAANKEIKFNKVIDKKKKELVDTKNDIEQLIYATEKAIKDLGDKVDLKIFNSFNNEKSSHIPLIFSIFW